MSEHTPDRPKAQVGPRYVFLGTVEHDCLSGLPADAPERAWPVVEAFPQYVSLGTVVHDCLSGRPADAPERSWPVGEWGLTGSSPTEVPLLVLTLTLRPGSDAQRAGNVIAQLLHALSRQEAALGGQGLSFRRSESTSDNGTVTLLLRPMEARGAAERLNRVVAFLQQCSSSVAGGPAAILDVVEASFGALAQRDPAELVKQSWTSAAFERRDSKVLTNSDD